MRWKDDEDFDGSVLQPELTGFSFFWESRPIADKVHGLQHEGHLTLALDLAEADRPEREKPENLKSANTFNWNLKRFQLGPLLSFSTALSGPRRCYSTMIANIITPHPTCAVLHLGHGSSLLTTSSFSLHPRRQDHI